VWEASGHLAGFNDPMVDCRLTKGRYRADQLFVVIAQFPKPNEKGETVEPWFAGVGSSPEEASIEPSKKVEKLKKRHGTPAWGVLPSRPIDSVARARGIGPATDQPGTLTEARAFNLMFSTKIGALEDESSTAYLRPETAQGIFVNYR